MEFIKVGKNWLIKGSNGRLVNDEEKRQLENNELVIKPEPCKECEIKIPKTTDVKFSKKKYKKPNAKITATSKKEIADDSIKETNSITE